LTDNRKIGIDISTYQKSADWGRAAADGISFAMIKATQGRSEGDASLYLFTDSCFEQNILGAAENGIACGVYHYLTASDTAGALEEADYFLSVIAPFRRQITLYAAVDVESKYLPTDKARLTEIADVFCARVEAAGFVPMVYTNPAFLANRLGDIGKWKLWLALWRDRSQLPDPACYPNLTLWQWGAENRSWVGGSGAVALNLDLSEEAMDTDTVSDWAVQAMAWAEEAGLFIGDENGALRPSQPITREQAALLFFRFLDYLKGQSHLFR